MGSSRRYSARRPQGRLTRPERQVLALLVTSMTNKEIARQLSLSEKTIRNSVSEMLSKLGLRNRTELAVWALKSGPADQEDNNLEIR